jgi:hypothetical protein
MQKVFPLKTSMKVFCWIMAVICLPLIVTIPGTVLMLMLGLRGKFVANDDSFSATWIMTTTVPWKEVTQVEWGRPAGGVVGALMGRPLHYFRNGKRCKGILVNSYERTAEILALFKERSNVAPPA